MITGLHHTAICVSDIERSLAFYRDLLGLKVLRQVELSDQRLDQVVGLPGARLKVAILQVGNSQERLELMQYLSPQGRPLPAELRQCDVGVTHVCFTVTDIERLSQDLVDRGVRFNSPVQTMDPTEVGTAKIVYLHDPDGITLELLEIVKEAK